MKLVSLVSVLGKNMMHNENGKKLTAEQYLSKHYLEIYFKDIVVQLLHCKTKNIRVNMSTFMHNYFCNVKNGSNVLFREYAYVRATPRNRLSFLKNVLNFFQHFNELGVMLNIKEYHSLLCLLCHDFEYELLQKTARTILTDDAIDCSMSFNDFIKGFQLQFYYNEFCTKCKGLFKQLVESRTSNKEGEFQQDTAKSREKVTSNDFIQLIRKEIYGSKLFYGEYLVPPEDILYDIMKPFSKTSFYGFMMALMKCEKLNSSIGVLTQSKRNASITGR